MSAGERIVALRLTPEEVSALSDMAARRERTLESFIRGALGLSPAPLAPSARPRHLSVVSAGREREPPSTARAPRAG